MIVQEFVAEPKSLHHPSFGRDGGEEEEQRRTKRKKGKKTKERRKRKAQG